MFLHYWACTNSRDMMNSIAGDDTIVVQSWSPKMAKNLKFSGMLLSGVYCYIKGFVQIVGK